jgi:hypothetical protein
MSTSATHLKPPSIGSKIPRDEQPTAEELKEREALAGQIDEFCEKAEKQAKN